ncbi:hypothetical protein [Nitrobacter sp.]|uniref:hypothetical protein n=1 Tax=unclassified Nitrobacter TaxID=2620411 RepID=UPI0032201837
MAFDPHPCATLGDATASGAKAMTVAAKTDLKRNIFVTPCSGIPIEGFAPRTKRGDNWGVPQRPPWSCSISGARIRFNKKIPENIFLTRRLGINLH